MSNIIKKIFNDIHHRRITWQIDRIYRILSNEIHDMIIFGKRIVQSKDNGCEFTFYQKDFEDAYWYILDQYKEKKCVVSKTGKYNYKVKVRFYDKKSAMEFKLRWS